MTFAGGMTHTLAAIFYREICLTRGCTCCESCHPLVSFRARQTATGDASSAHRFDRRQTPAWRAAHLVLEGYTRVERRRRNNPSGSDYVLLQRPRTCPDCRQGERCRGTPARPAAGLRVGCRGGSQRARQRQQGDPDRQRRQRRHRQPPRHRVPEERRHPRHGAERPRRADLPQQRPRLCQRVLRAAEDAGRTRRHADRDLELRASRSTSSRPPRWRARTA